MNNTGRILSRNEEGMF